MLLVMFYVDDDHYHVNKKKGKEAQVPSAGKSMHLIVSHKCRRP